MPSLFFIAGCQRSGTTLMRLVLESHPEIHCFDEIQGYAVLAGGNIETPPGKSWAGFKIPRWTEQLDDPLLSDQGQSETCPNKYRQVPVVFMLRDVRDCVASMLKLKQNSKNWLEVWGTQILFAKIASPPFRQRYAREIKILQQFKNSLPAVGALYWKYKTQSFFDYCNTKRAVYPVRYEDLVRSPERDLRRLLDFLGVSWHADVLNHAQLGHLELCADGTAVGNTNPQRAIDTESLGQWPRFLTDDDERQVLAIAGDLNSAIHKAA